MSLPTECAYEYATTTVNAVDFFLVRGNNASGNHSSFVRYTKEKNGLETSVLLENGVVIGHGMRVTGDDAKGRGYMPKSNQITCSYNSEFFVLRLGDENKKSSSDVVLPALLVAIAGTILVLAARRRARAPDSGRRPEVVGTEQKTSPRVFRKEICESYIEV